jgi:hypothetical protein
MFVNYKYLGRQMLKSYSITVMHHYKQQWREYLAY